MAAGPRHVQVSRTALGEYLVSNDQGVTVRTGTGDDLLSPVELLLGAIGACTAVDVDVVTARRSEPEAFTVDVSAERITDEQGGARMQDVEVVFRVRFPDDASGRQAAALVPRLVQLSHDKDCTVSRTVEFPTAVTSRVEPPEA